MATCNNNYLSQLHNDALIINNSPWDLVRSEDELATNVSTTVVSLVLIARNSTNNTSASKSADKSSPWLFCMAEGNTATRNIKKWQVPWWLSLTSRKSSFQWQFFCILRGQNFLNFGKSRFKPVWLFYGPPIKIINRNYEIMNTFIVYGLPIW